MKISFSPPDITEAEINEVADALRSGWITTGPRTKQLEKQIAEWFKVPKAVCLNSATAALELTLHVLGIGPGDEVITSAYTYTASASPVVHLGAKLVLVDTALDSILVLLDILSLKIADFRQQAHYILVYNADANMENKNLLDNHDYANKAKDNIVPDYKELEPLTVPLFKLSGMKMVKFGVNMFKKYCFNEVYTFSKEEFQEYVAKNL